MFLNVGIGKVAGSTVACGVGISIIAGVVASIEFSAPPGVTDNDRVCSVMSPVIPSTANTVATAATITDQCGRLDTLVKLNPLLLGLREGEPLDYLGDSMSQAFATRK